MVAQLPFLSRSTQKEMLETESERGIVYFQLLEGKLTKSTEWGGNWWCRRELVFNLCVVSTALYITAMNHMRQFTYRERRSFWLMIWEIPVQGHVNALLWAFRVPVGSGREHMAGKPLRSWARNREKKEKEETGISQLPARAWAQWPEDLHLVTRPSEDIWEPDCAMFYSLTSPSLIWSRLLSESITQSNTGFAWHSWPWKIKVEAEGLFCLHLVSSLHEIGRCRSNLPSSG